MNSITLIDSVLTRSFSTSSVPQRRRPLLQGHASSSNLGSSGSNTSTSTSSKRTPLDNDDDDDDEEHGGRHGAAGQDEDDDADNAHARRPHTSGQMESKKQKRQMRKQDSEPSPARASTAASWALAPLSFTRLRKNDGEAPEDQQQPMSSSPRQQTAPGHLQDKQEDDELSPPRPVQEDRDHKAMAQELKEPAKLPEPPALEAATATAAAVVSAQPPPKASASAKPIPRGPSSVIRQTPKILVLDLDETLIHSTSRPRPGYELGHRGGPGAGATALLRGGFGFGWLLGLDGLGALLGLRGRAHPGRLRTHMVEVVLEGRSLIYHVYKRPWVDYFLRKVAAWYHVVVYTASVQEYADPVIDWLDQGRGLISGRLFRDACTFSNGAYLKNLSIVDADLARVCLVDNSPASYLINPANGIPIEGWTHDPNDEALLDLLPVLDSLRFASDVRNILGLRGF